MRNHIFDAYSRYYDMLYCDKDYIAETEYVVGLLNRFGVTGKEVLEFGSGTGVHGRLLAERGFRVIGIERSAKMVAQALTAPGFSCKQADICAVRLGQTFDAVLSLFHVVSYQIANDAVKAVFDSASKHLVTDGLFVFDVWYTPCVYSQRPEVRLKRMVDETLEVTRIAEPVTHPNKNKVEVNYTIFTREISTGKSETFSETHVMRHFSIPEIELIAQMSGFAIVGVEEFLTSKIPSDETWGVCFILRKL